MTRCYCCITVQPVWYVYRRKKPNSVASFVTTKFQVTQLEVVLPSQTLRGLLFLERRCLVLSLSTCFCQSIINVTWYELWHGLGGGGCFGITSINDTYILWSAQSYQSHWYYFIRLIFTGSPSHGRGYFQTVLLPLIIRREWITTSLL